MARKRRFTITAQDLSAAVQAFKDAGGLIKTLPAEVPLPKRSVRTKQEGAYECILPVNYSERRARK